MLSILMLSDIVKAYDAKPFYLKLMTPTVIVMLRKFKISYGPGAYLNEQDMTTLVRAWHKNPLLFSELSIPLEFKNFLLILEKLDRAGVLTAVTIGKLAACQKTSAIIDVLDILDCVSEKSAIAFLLNHLDKAAVLKNIVLILNHSKLMPVYMNYIVQAQHPQLQLISDLLDSVCTLENKCKVMMSGQATCDELVRYFSHEITLRALIKLFKHMEKYALLDGENINKILKYADNDSIIDLVAHLDVSVNPRRVLVTKLQETLKVMSINQVWQQQQKTVPVHQRFLIENGHPILVRGMNPTLIVLEKKPHSNIASKIL
jgi:hypothetical protein